jgi:hypothetical protein
MTPKLEADRGERVRVVLARVRRFLETEEPPRVDPGARVIERGAGQEVVYDEKPSLPQAAFRVLLVDRDRITIAPGLVNNVVPVVYDEVRKKKIRLDGLDEEGEPVEGGPPRMKLTPHEDSRSYVVLRALEATRALPNPAAGFVDIHEYDHKEFTRLSQRTEDALNAFRLRVVAVIDWNRRQVVSIRQAVWFDQELMDLDRLRFVTTKRINGVLA